MGNADDHDDYDEELLTPRCGYCGTPVLAQRKGAMYCTRRCKELSAAKRRRDRARVTELRQKYPDADRSLQELYARATPPRHVNEDQRDDESYVDDEYGYFHEASAGPGAWSDIYRIHEAEQAIRARYAPRMQPYLVQLKRNPGVRPAGLVALERERDDEIAEMMQEYDQAADMDRARRREPQRINDAHERQGERAALQAFSNDLPGGSRRYQVQEYHGRPTHALWDW